MESITLDFPTILCCLIRMPLTPSWASTQMPPSIASNFHPSFKTFSTERILKLHSFKPTSSLEIPPLNLVFVRGFVSKEALIRKNGVWGCCGMAELTRTSSIRCANGDEGFGSLETESFFDGSSEFHPEIAAGGLEALLNKLSKWLVAALFAAIILLRHDAEALWTAMGSVINAILSIVLKRILNQERPIATLRPDPGMPSSHAQSIFFIVIFAALSAVEWLGVNAISLSVCGLSFIFGSYFSWLRVSQKLHTISQVLVGSVLGGSFAILWYLFWKAVVSEAFSANLWVQIVVAVGASGFCVGFVIYVLNNWFKDEKSV
ncbi:lipid phosphate phosphatase epsilon 1, chloroplastic-like [Cucurbita pepo subsp. pepo]|uniref:lipid phosphate phosphatase epsilon 1, chloroplastic-like n=1 Tax=Cucurbita pepo subsp. pepo TaxID=3664 RepID=UPI000C9D6E43|nr:lipid phosphate phosphatase epsilon 1, chloroplastic-like [Cucurbita pepo subsp. pepo]